MRNVHGFVGPCGAPAGLFTPGYYQALKAPVAVIGKDVDAQLRRTSNPVRLVLDVKYILVRFRNMLAQTKAGDPHNVVASTGYRRGVTCN